MKNNFKTKSLTHYNIVRIDTFLDPKQNIGHCVPRRKKQQFCASEAKRILAKATAPFLAPKDRRVVLRSRRAEGVALQYYFYYTMLYYCVQTSAADYRPTGPPLPVQLLLPSSSQSSSLRTIRRLRIRAFFRSILRECTLSCLWCKQFVWACNTRSRVLLYYPCSEYYPCFKVSSALNSVVDGTCQR